MSWTRSEYPAEMKYLPARVRNKAITIANLLLKETGMQEGRVIKAAISKARRSSSKKEHSQDKGLKGRGRKSKEQFRDRSVIPYEGGWAIRIEMSSVVESVFTTKKDAVEQAKREAYLTGAGLTICGKDGSVQRKIKGKHSKSPGGKSARSRKK